MLMLVNYVGKNELILVMCDSVFMLYNLYM